MKDINTLTLTGGVTRDADLKYTNAGTAICNFSLGYTRNIKKGDQWQNKSCYIGCTMWGKRAESLHQYLLKGQQLAIQGELDFDQWDEADTGNHRTKHSIIINDIKLLGGNKKNTAPAAAENFEDDIPF